MPNLNQKIKLTNVRLTIIKTVCVLFVVAMPFAAKSQKKEIINILNSALKYELKHQYSSSNFDGDSTVLLHGFTIDANSVLSVEIKKTLRNSEGYMIEKQSVPLNKAAYIIKDINVIVESKNEDVVITTRYFYKDGRKKTETRMSNLFFIHLHFPNNEHIGNKLVKAFKNAGYNVEKPYWYD